MGTDKATMSWKGVPLAEHVAGRLESVSDDVFVVAKAALDVSVRVVLDQHEVQSPLAGVAAALRSARHPWVFVCACDMPLVKPEVVSLLASDVGDAGALYFERDGRVEPLHALWCRSALPVLERALDDHRLAAHAVLSEVGTSLGETWRAVDPEGSTFANLNTPEELENLRA
jgi:molybdenum cofactor guanylyltransferase